jgi:4-hydroxy-tetrahydrodipicolinate synthase
MGETTVLTTRLPAPQRELRCGASLLTPFDKDGKVNEEVYRVQLRRLIEAGLDLWVLSSGTAEGNVLTVAEMDRLAQLAVEEAGAETTVYAMGNEPRSALQAIEFSKRMHDLGVGVVQVGPVEPGHSYMPNDDELRSFYDTVFAATEAPAVVASHMSAGYEIAPETLATVARDHAERVVGITATHLQNNTYIPRLLEAVGGKFPVWTGSPIRAMDSCAMGVRGINSSMDVNVAPQLYAAFVKAWAAGDLSQVTQAYRSMLRLFQRILDAGGLIIAKAILVRLGLSMGTTRPPRRAAGPAEYRIADEIIAEFGLEPL